MRSLHEDKAMRRSQHGLLGVLAAAAGGAPVSSQPSKAPVFSVRVVVVLAASCNGVESGRTYVDLREPLHGIKPGSVAQGHF